MRTHFWANPCTVETRAEVATRSRQQPAPAELFPRTSPTDPGDPARLEHARTVAEQNRCNNCHRRDFSGRESVPRLADQREDYLLKTLREYKSGARRAYEPIMAEVLQPMVQVPRPIGARCAREVKSGSHQTRWWRKADSNLRSLP